MVQKMNKIEKGKVGFSFLLKRNYSKIIGTHLYLTEKKIEIDIDVVSFIQCNESITVTSSEKHWIIMEMPSTKSRYQDLLIKIIKNVKKIFKCNEKWSNKQVISIKNKQEEISSSY